MNTLDCDAEHAEVTAKRDKFAVLFYSSTLASVGAWNGLSVQKGRQIRRPTPCTLHHIHLESGMADQSYLLCCNVAMVEILYHSQEIVENQFCHCRAGLVLRHN